MDKQKISKDPCIIKMYVTTCQITASPLHVKMHTEKCRVPNKQSNYPINTEILMCCTLTVEKLDLFLERTDSQNQTVSTFNINYIKLISRSLALFEKLSVVQITLLNSKYRYLETTVTQMAVTT
jgi:hypothetical protein